MKIINNTTEKLADDLRVTIKKRSRVSMAAACFSVYAFEELKAQLENLDELRFIFTSPAFLDEKPKKAQREFYIPRLNRERTLHGSEFEIKLRSEFRQRAISQECAHWIREKARFKSNKTMEGMTGFLTVDSDSPVAYAPVNGFTREDLGCDRGGRMFSMINRVDAPESKAYLELFDQLWNDQSHLKDVTDKVLESITTAYQENSPEFLYFYALYNIFGSFLEQVNEDDLPSEANGFKESQVWNKLYTFQKDAVIAIISKLEQYNGCILADSVGLGKTFTALAVIKYYENRNLRVLVLCPKKLSDNWMTYKANYVNNPIAGDRLRYDVLYHTDLSRDKGFSGEIDLSKLNWSAYDLVVIDESHNFRNGGDVDNEGKENRYTRLMNKVIRPGARTRVLMLSATPVNNRFYDLRNQLALAYEGDSSEWQGKLDISRSVEEVFRNAQKVFNEWSKLDVASRTTDQLMQMLDFEFFQILDAVTIARSRRHIEKYYDVSEIGKFPTRLPPISKRPPLTDLPGAISYSEIYDDLLSLTLSIYTPNLWNRINHKSFYTVQFDTPELIDHSIRALDSKLNVTRVQINLEYGEQTARLESREQLEQGKGFQKARSDRESAKYAPLGSVRYDLVGKLVEETGLTRATVAAILRGIAPQTFSQFRINPEEFILKAARLINDEKATQIIEHITYNRLDAAYDQDVFTRATLRGKLDVNAMEANRSLYSHVIYDSDNERRFAQELDVSDQVAVYVKLPGSFYISTPVGKYNPDWAIAFNEGSVKHIYFVAETKGNLDTMELRGVENAKIECAKKHFAAISNGSVVYSVVDNYSTLMQLVSN